MKSYETDQTLCRDILSVVTDTMSVFTITTVMIGKYNYPKPLDIKKHLDYLVSRGHLEMYPEGLYGPPREGVKPYGIYEY